MAIGTNPAPGNDAYGNDNGPMFINDAAPAGAIAPASGAPTVTVANTDTLYTLSKQANRFLVQNNSPAVAYVELDAAATTGSVAIPSGQSWRDDIQVTVFHLLTVAAQPINAINGIVIRSWQ